MKQFTIGLKTFLSFGFQSHIGCHEGEEKYFFKLQEAKYRKRNRSNRATRSGYWKSTGKDRSILCSKRDEVVGMKKVLVFHQGKPPHGIRTRWIMHEYRLASPDQTLASSTSPQRKNSVQVSFPCLQLVILLAIWARRSSATSLLLTSLLMCYGMEWGYDVLFSPPFQGLRFF